MIFNILIRDNKSRYKKGLKCYSVFIQICSVRLLSQSKLDLLTVKIDIYIDSQIPCVRGRDSSPAIEGELYSVFGAIVLHICK